jgi:hypothetical protein
MMVLTPPRRATALYLALMVLLCAVVGFVLAPGILAREQPSISMTQTLTNAATGSGTIGTGGMTTCRETAIYAQWTTGTSAGVVTIETAHDVNYTGTWAALTTITWSAASKEDVVQITGVMGAIRTRISTTVVGGTGVNVFAICN